jgi:hypothetical protein
MISSLVRGRDWWDGRGDRGADVQFVYHSDAGNLIFL